MMHAMTDSKVSREFLRHIWKHECNMDMDKAANYILDCVADKSLLDKEVEWRNERHQQHEFVSQYGYETPRTSEVYKPPKEVEKRVRFRDNEVVTLKGEKYILEKPKEWDGGSRGKVKTKGKRGKGYA